MSPDCDPTKTTPSCTRGWDRARSAPGYANTHLSDSRSTLLRSSPAPSLCRWFLALPPQPCMAAASALASSLMGSEQARIGFGGAIASPAKKPASTSRSVTDKAAACARITPLFMAFNMVAAPIVEKVIMCGARGTWPSWQAAQCAW